MVIKFACSSLLKILLQNNGKLTLCSGQLNLIKSRCSLHTFPIHFSKSKNKFKMDLCATKQQYIGNKCNYRESNIFDASKTYDLMSNENHFNTDRHQWNLFSCTVRPTVPNNNKLCDYSDSFYKTKDMRFNHIGKFGVNSRSKRDGPILNDKWNIWRHTKTIPAYNQFYPTVRHYSKHRNNSDLNQIVRNYSNQNNDLPGVLKSHVASLQAKKKVQRKKKTVDEGSQGEWQVTAYATADEYDLTNLKDALIKQGLYKPASNSLEDVLHVVETYHLSSEPREIYFFRDGAVIFWNVAVIERDSILQFLKNYETESYPILMAQEECESLTYVYTECLKTRLSKDKIYLSSEGCTPLEKYTFSNALSMSVKLGIWEESLDKYIENIEYVSEELSKTGKVVLTQGQVLQRMGQLFALRHLLNLSSDFLDTPDFYWDQVDLENLYVKTFSHLCIAKRTSVLNVKLSHCVDLMELLKSHLSEKHAARLETIIIVLIMIEIAFEVLHFITSFYK